MTPPTPVAPSISIATVNGSPFTGQDIHATDKLTFNTSVPKLAGWEYPMIAVVGFQDVNEDGVVESDIQSPDIVYSWLDKPGIAMDFSSGSSIWSYRIADGHPSAAKFRADLCAYGWKGGKESVRVLAFVNFDVV